MGDIIEEAESILIEAQQSLGISEESATIRRVLQDKYRRRYPLFDTVELPDNVGIYGLPGNDQILMVVSRVLYGNVGSVTHMDLFLRTPDGLRLLEMIGTEGGQ